MSSINRKLKLKTHNNIGKFSKLSRQSEMADRLDFERTSDDI